ncbi:cysteinyl leukotriene receptor 1-like [Ruditapes philippinarum]|uniref:cysteinyl leukotriene receptor 1-like n=1 Tax=Ruditapes philippinarum TaxID=129788 RepID=UPI00295BAD83|nr:cysteinyl leukotriene receptor 1-like [Ruditapes philippinarum]
MDNITNIINTTASIMNGTTERGPTPLPATPPPLGYYGDTRVMMWKIVPPIIMLWGTIGNILTIIVLFRQKSKLSSTALYLVALAISDTMVLFTGPLRHWLKETWDYNIRFKSEAGCKLQLYFTYAALHCSSWLLVAVTTERAVSVVYPHKVRLVSTKKTATIVIALIVIITYGINIVIPVINGHDTYMKLQKCAPTTKEYLEFRDDIYHWIDFCLTFALPFIFLLVGNISIIVCLQRSRAKQKTMTSAHGRGGSSTTRDTRSVSVLMIALCVIFFLTMTPVSIFTTIYYPNKYDIINELFKTDPYQAWDDYQFLLFQHSVVNLVSYTNAAFNFILYVFSGSKFRKELKSLFMCSASTTTGAFSQNTVKSSKTVSTSVSATRQSKYQYGKDENGTQSNGTNNIQMEATNNDFSDSATTGEKDPIE